MAKTTSQCDIGIVGGGPAGLTIGILLAKDGFDVNIFERDRHPRHHIGESLLPATFPVLKKLGITRDLLRGRFQPKYGARFYDTACDRITTFGFISDTPGEPPPSFQVLRGDFDALLAQHALDAGCHLHQDEPVTGADESANPPVIHLADDSHCRCKFLVDATGQAALLARKRGSRKIVEGFGHLAIYNYFTNLPPHDQHDADYITMYVFDGGWVWLIPLAGGVTSVGVVLSKSRVQPALSAEMQFEHIVATMPRLSRRLMAATPTAPYRAAADYSYHVDELYGDRFALVGDATGFLDPIFSSGVHLAIMSADQAAAAIVKHLRNNDPTGLADYQSYMRRGFATFERFVDWFYHRNLVGDLFFSPNQPAKMRDAIVNILSGYVWDLDNPLIKALHTSDEIGSLQCTAR